LPGGAEDGEEMAPALTHGALVGTPQLLELVGAPDHRRAAPPRSLLADVTEPVRGQRLRLPLRLERRQQLGVDGVAHERIGRGPKEDFAGRGRLLEPRGDIDGVARRERVRASGHDLARVDADPDVDLDRVAKLGGRAHGAERVVLVHDRHAEHGHDRVADELLHRSPVTLDRRPRRLEVPGHHGAHRFRVELLAETRRTRHVAEEHGDDLPLLTRCGGRRERSRAGVTEPCVVGVVAPAFGADDHRRSLRREGAAGQGSRRRPRFPSLSGTTSLPAPGPGAR